MNSNKIKKYIFPLLLLICVVSISVHYLVPIYLQSNMMGEFNKGVFSNKKGHELHPKLFVADMHADVLLWERDFFSRNDYGHVDLPRLQEGNVSLQIFTIVTKAPKSMNINKTDDSGLDRITPLSIVQGWPIQSWFSLFSRAVHQISRLKKWESRSKNQLMIIRSRKDMRDFIELKTFQKKMVAAIIGLEGAHALEKDLIKLKVLFQEGLRVLGLTHFFDNAVAGSAHGVKKGGLTKFGKEVIERANKYGIIFDLSHLSEKASFEVIKLSKKPVINTHTGLRGKCKNERNISDELAKAVAETGGIIGIGFWPTATCGQTTKSIVDMIKYATELVGVEHVGLGSDFDGTVKTPIDSSSMKSITSELIVAGYSNEDIAKIMGGNLKEFFLKYLP
ncbi:MAG: dipeptidase [Bacteriovoracaceae bacterium]|nr:dipeptidase [Bacteriovoracaceae bacterium]